MIACCTVLFGCGRAREGWVRSRRWLASCMKFRSRLIGWRTDFTHFNICMNWKGKDERPHCVSILPFCLISRRVSWTERGEDKRFGNPNLRDISYHAFGSAKSFIPSCHITFRARRTRKSFTFALHVSSERSVYHMNGRIEKGWGWIRYESGRKRVLIDRSTWESSRDIEDLKIQIAISCCYLALPCDAVLISMDCMGWVGYGKWENRKGS